MMARGLEMRVLEGVNTRSLPVSVCESFCRGPHTYKCFFRSPEKLESADQKRTINKYNLD